MGKKFVDTYCSLDQINDDDHFCANDFRISIMFLNLLVVLLLI